jgi:hypothetical protein
MNANIGCVDCEFLMLSIHPWANECDMEDQHHHARLFASTTPILEGRLWAGPLESRDPSKYRKITTKSLNVFAVNDHSTPVKSTVYLLSHDPIYLHGEAYYWVAIVLHGLESKYVRVHPMTERLETTQLLDSTSRLLVSMNQTTPQVNHVKLVDSAYGMHKRALPHTSLNALRLDNENGLVLVPSATTDLYLHLISE